MYASATTYVDVIPQICLYFPISSRAQRRPHHPTTTRVPLSGHAYGSETACHNRTARISSTRAAATNDPLTARCDLPRPPCVTPRTHVARGAVGHDQDRVCPLWARSHARANLRPPSHTARRPRPTGVRTPHARYSTTRPPPPHAHACEPESRRTHRSPSTPQPTPLPRRPTRTHSTFLPAALYGTPSILTHRSPRTQNPYRTRRVVPLPAWGRRPPPSHTGAGPDRMPIKMCRSREPATTTGPERARISAPAPHGGAGQPGPP